ncbi:M50 family metallopeptidase [Peribacillus alkalitolerans]|uniref:M50 family metallopeptidase n=1 Tax=Peribacillus alkalitolerans TaxID=1550385 RepID=UPI0013D78759|nr:M50 family metallopeptidase [Peribacillus alkalitolerans]
MIKYMGLFPKVRIHPTLWIVAGLSVMTAHFVHILMLFLILFIHEMGHAAAAHYYKWRIKAISILPFGGAMETEEHGNRPLKEDLIVTLAGPIQHVWLLLVALFTNKMGLLPHDLFQIFLYLNLGVLFFNLLPIWPLDGGKLLLLTLSKRKSYMKSQERTLQLSVLFCVAFALLILFISPLNLSAWIMMGFILFSIWMEWKQRHYSFIRFLLERHYGKNDEIFALSPIEADENMKIYKVLEQFQRGSKHPIIIMKNGKERGMLDETELLHAYFSEKQIHGKVGDLLYSY